MIAAADQSPGVIMVNADDDDEESESDDKDKLALEQPTPSRITYRGRLMYLDFNGLGHAYVRAGFSTYMANGLGHGQ